MTMHAGRKRPDFFHCRDCIRASQGQAMVRRPDRRSGQPFEEIDLARLWDCGMRHSDQRLARMAKRGQGRTHARIGQ